MDQSKFDEVRDAFKKMYPNVPVVKKEQYKSSKSKENKRSKSVNDSLVIKKNPVFIKENKCIPEPEPKTSVWSSIKIESKIMIVIAIVALFISFITMLLLI